MKISVDVDNEDKPLSYWLNKDRGKPYVTDHAGIAACLFSTSRATCRVPKKIKLRYKVTKPYDESALRSKCLKEKRPTNFVDRTKQGTIDRLLARVDNGLPLVGMVNGAEGKMLASDLKYYFGGVKAACNLLGIDYKRTCRQGLDEI